MLVAVLKLVNDNRSIDQRGNDAGRNGTKPAKEWPPCYVCVLTKEEEGKEGMSGILANSTSPKSPYGAG